MLRVRSFARVCFPSLARSLDGALTAMLAGQIKVGP